MSYASTPYAGGAYGAPAAVVTAASPRPLGRPAQIVQERGAEMTLRRTGETSLVIKGVAIQGSIEITGNSAAQQVFRVKITPLEIEASGWSAKSPKRNDTLEIDGRRHALLDARALKILGRVELYELTVAG